MKRFCPAACSKTLGIAAAVLSLVAGMLLLAWLDAAWALSLRPAGYAFALLPVLVALPARRERPVQVALAVYLAALVSLPFLTLSPVKPFTRFFASVQPGMDETEVLERLGRHFPGDGSVRRPVPSRSDDGHLWFILDPENGAYNAELVTIRMQDGRVVSKQYLPD